MKPLSPQTQTVLAHLRSNGHLTSWQAEGVYRIRRLASRVDELRAAGFEIETETREDAAGQRYTRYRLSRRQKRAKAPLLPTRVVPKQLRIDNLLGIYRRYCRDELGMSGEVLDDEITEFTKYLQENAE